MKAILHTSTSGQVQAPPKRRRPVNKGIVPAFLNTILASLLLFGLVGCMANRGVLDVQVSLPPNPASDRAVTILVTDSRKFIATPKQVTTPSLLFESEIYNKELTSRAIARKHVRYNTAIGDIVLPEGRTVEMVVREALVKSFRESGYRVIDDATASKDAGIPIEADIEQFWSWNSYGFWSIPIEFEAKVHIKGDLPPFKTGETVRGYVKINTQAPDTRAWLKTINKGIEAFICEVKNRLVKKE